MKGEESVRRFSRNLSQLPAELKVVGKKVPPSVSGVLASDEG